MKRPVTKPAKRTDLASRLRALRRRQGLNQEQLERRSGVTQATISRIESGKAKDLRARTLRRLADALGVTTDFFTSERTNLEARDQSLLDPFVAELLSLTATFGAFEKAEVLDFTRYLARRTAPAAARDKPSAPFRPDVKR